MPTQVVHINVSILSWYFEDANLQNEPDRLTMLMDLKDAIEKSLNIWPHNKEIVWVDNDGNSVDVDLQIEKMSDDGQ